jgi:hypothetical protein
MAENEAFRNLLRRFCHCRAMPFLSKHRPETAKRRFLPLQRLCQAKKWFISIETNRICFAKEFSPMI